MKDILILEDGPQERERLDRLFNAAGYSVCACATVADAERCVQSDSYRLAILDIGLSDKSGSYFFDTLKRASHTPHILILTGNPSVRLKERFLSEGAVDYIVKASPQAQADNLLNRVREIIGKAEAGLPAGMALEVFLRDYVDQKSHSLFFDQESSFPACGQCHSRQYVVEFSSQAQVPPEVKGMVVCAVCGKPMDPQVG